MSKITWTFDMSNPEDEKELILKTKSIEMAIAIWDVEQLFRNELKYNEELTNGEYKIVESLQERYFEIINGHGVVNLIE